MEVFVLLPVEGAFGGSLGLIFGHQHGKADTGQVFTGRSRGAG